MTGGGRAGGGPPRTGAQRRNPTSAQDRAAAAAVLPSGALPAAGPRQPAVGRSQRKVMAGPGRFPGVGVEDLGALTFNFPGQTTPRGL